MTYDEERFEEPYEVIGPEWTVDEECAARGHEYHGDDHPDAPDGWGGRCYCGTRRYPTGGPEQDEVLQVPAVLVSSVCGEVRRGRHAAGHFPAAARIQGGRTIGPSDLTPAAAGQRLAGSGSGGRRHAGQVGDSQVAAGDDRSPAGHGSAGGGGLGGAAHSLPDAESSVEQVSGGDRDSGRSPASGEGTGEPGGGSPVPELPSDLAYWRSRVDEVVRRTAGLYRPSVEL